MIEYAAGVILPALFSVNNLKAVFFAVLQKEGRNK